VLGRMAGHGGVFHVYTAAATLVWLRYRNGGSSNAEYAGSNRSLPSCPSYNEPVRFRFIESQLRVCAVPVAVAGLAVRPQVY